MWSDDFDMDLYKVLPEAREIIAPLKDVQLITHGIPTDGKINLPCCWWTDTGLTAFFRTKGGPDRPTYYWTDALPLECTFEEAMIDCWPHDYTILLNNRYIIWNSAKLHGEFQEIMYHLRGWHKYEDALIEKDKQRVLYSMRGAVERLRAALSG